MFVPHRKHMSADKKGIVISSDPESIDGKVQFTVAVHKSVAVKFHIVNKGPNNIYFTDYNFLDRIRCFTLEYKRDVNEACSYLCPGEATNSHLPFSRIQVYKNGQRLSIHSYCILFSPPSDERYDLAVRFNLNQCGYFPATICFEFQPDQPKPERFCIIRKIEATVQSSLGEKLGVELGPVAPYRPFHWTKSKSAPTNVVMGIPPQE